MLSWFWFYLSCSTGSGFLRALCYSRLAVLPSQPVPLGSRRRGTHMVCAWGMRSVTCTDLELDGKAAMC
jgi:hypothetical protein